MKAKHFIKIVYLSATDKYTFFFVKGEGTDKIVTRWPIPLFLAQGFPACLYLCFSLEQRRVNQVTVILDKS